MLINFLSCAHGKTEKDEDIIEDFKEDDAGGLYATLVEQGKKHDTPNRGYVIPPTWTLEDVLCNLPRLKPRLYSISSSPLADKKSLTISVGVQPMGVCSNYLKNIQVGESVYVSIRDTRSKFRLPDADNVPVVMIGAERALPRLWDSFKSFKLKGVARTLSYFSAAEERTRISSTRTRSTST